MPFIIFLNKIQLGSLSLISMFNCFQFTIVNILVPATLVITFEGNRTSSMIFEGDFLGYFFIID